MTNEDYMITVRARIATVEGREMIDILDLVEELERNSNEILVSYGGSIAGETLHALAEAFRGITVP